MVVILPLVIGLTLVSILFFYLSTSFDSKHGIFPLAFLFLGLLILLVTVGVLLEGIIIYSGSVNLMSIFSSVYKVVMVVMMLLGFYIFLKFITETFTRLKNKKQMRLEY